MLYFDTSYLVRLYSRDVGWEKVRALARTGAIACSIHGYAETVAAFHRKFREQSIDRKELREVIGEFENESEAGAFRWFPVSPTIISRVTRTYEILPASIALRAADAVHLASAAENNYSQIYSNDARLLAAARHFGLDGVSVI